jgi:hypothetical protein
MKNFAVENEIIRELQNKIIKSNPNAIISKSEGKHFLGFGVLNKMEDTVHNVQRIFEIFPRDDRLKGQRKLLKKLERVPIERQRELELEYLKPGKIASLNFVGELLNRVSERLITLVVSNDEDFVTLQRFVTDPKDNYVVLDDNQWLMKAVRRYAKKHPAKQSQKSKKCRRKKNEAEEVL